MIGFAQSTHLLYRLEIVTTIPSSFEGVKV
jgi:hypothetical protein